MQGIVVQTVLDVVVKAKVIVCFELYHTGW